MPRRTTESVKMKFTGVRDNFQAVRAVGDPLSSNNDYDLLQKFIPISNYTYIDSYEGKYLLLRKKREKVKDFQAFKFLLV